MSTATVEVRLLDRLRKLAEVMEEHSFELNYAMLSADGTVHVYEEDFKALFRGQPVHGKRRGNMVEVVGDAFGITFKAQLYLPLPEQLEFNETITVA